MPGISVSKIPIPFNKGGGISWSSYWNTLISATVENAAPTHVVLTFPSAASLGASDFTISGFTISSASWTGAVLTLVLSTPVVMFIGDLTITFVKTGETATVINNTDDGNTVGWYEVGDGSATYLTKDGSNNISQLNDLSGSGNHLINSSGDTTRMPVYESGGILFNKNDYLQTGDFDYAQPEILYLVFMSTSLARNTLFDGLLNNRGQVGIRTDLVANNYYAYAGIVADTGIAYIPINNKALMIIMLNGTSSMARVNGTSSVVLSVGTQNMQGITLGADHDINVNFGMRGYVYELIARKAADDLATRTAIEKYLNDKYSVFF